ncbi:putrescine aminopropyltransferase [Ascosphaera pollenicola]|nr:putrescine aminopropyltransferase [Ascosphaera pollenicola]
MAGELTHPTIKDGWFSEISEMWPGQAMTLRVKEILHHEKSKFQDVLVFESTDYGTVLVLDNVIQCTERDEFSYQEMITHLGMMSHPNPKRVLVVGGGDGGVLREVVKHESVEKAILVDIDEAVPRVSKKFLPNMAIGFEHPNVEVIIGDGFEYLKNHKNEFDVIITDSSDPEGPAEALFQKPYFDLLYEALTPAGVVTTQGCSYPAALRPPHTITHMLKFNPFPFYLAENQWLHMPLITRLKNEMLQTFPVAEYAYTTIPTYPSGQIGFMVASKDPSVNMREPLRTWTREEEERLCRFYNKDIHRAAFILPNFARKVLECPVDKLDTLPGKIPGKMQ